MEEELIQALGDFLMARAVMSTEALEEAIMYPTRKVELDVSRRNVMSVEVPKIEYQEVSEEGLSSYPYGFCLHFWGIRRGYCHSFKGFASYVRAS